MTRTHPVSGAILIRGTRPLSVSVGSLTKVIDRLGWYAVDDHAGDDGLHDPDDMRVSDRATIELKRAAELLEEDNQRHPKSLPPRITAG